MSADFYSLPRIYHQALSGEGATVSLTDGVAHYLRNVLRVSAGDLLRAFDGQSGEYLLEITDVRKKEVVAYIREKIVDQPPAGRRIHLFFAPIKKARMDILVEKIVELGVTDIHPVLTERTQNRKINTDRLRAQIFEAAEQCERFDIPVLHPLLAMRDAVSGWGASLYWAAERLHDRRYIGDLEFAEAGENNDDMPVAFLVGPEGGFSPDEDRWLGAQEAVIPISLGRAILRAETASIICLSRVKMFLGQ